MTQSTAYRWIVYLQQYIPGNQSFDVQRVASIEGAKEQFATFCREVYSDECSATLYVYTHRRWEEAEEFRGIGCPFDYPDRVISRGPRGGVLVEKA